MLSKQFLPKESNHKIALPVLLMSNIQNTFLFTPTPRQISCPNYRRRSEGRSYRTVAVPSLPLHAHIWAWKRTCVCEKHTESRKTKWKKDLNLLTALLCHSEMMLWERRQSGNNRNIFSFFLIRFKNVQEKIYLFYNLYTHLWKGYFLVVVWHCFPFRSSIGYMVSRMSHKFLKKKKDISFSKTIYISLYKNICIVYNIRKSILNKILY